MGRACQGRQCSGGLAERHCGRDMARGAVGFPGSGDGPAGDDQTVETDRKHAGERDLERRRWHGEVDSDTVGVMQVHWPTPKRDAVTETTVRENVLLGQRHLADDPARLSDAHTRSDRRDPAISKARHFATKKFNGLQDLSTAFYLGT